MFSFRFSQFIAGSGIGLALLTAGCGSSTDSTTTVETTASAAAPAETTVAAAPVETTAAAVEVGAPVGDVAVALLSGGRQGAWFITQRVTNGGKPELPDCAKDDELIFDNKGGFISVIGGTPCNPSEVEVPAGTYKMAADKPVISFTTPGLSYDGKIITLTEKELVIEFDLGPGFLIQDTFSKR